MDIRLLGPVQIRTAHGETVKLNRRKERLALSVLVLEPSRVVSFDRLVDLLWGQAPPTAVRTSLQCLMSRIRAALRSAAPDCGHTRLEVRGSGYALRVRPEAVDLHRFRSLVRQARRIETPRLRSERLSTALDLWHGPALADTAVGPVREQLCDDLEESRFAAISARIDADLDAGRHAELVPELYRLAADHPLREPVHGQLVLALYRCGRRADALDAYRKVRRTLLAELGLEPGPQLRRLQDAVIGDAPELELAAR
ncbi:BTAD domain-containing putative transcriptional regulator [Actinoplanes sp. NPDC049599]|uniref:AfsR/SARP family transcriptional regulator n=1 Tax=Actinoplanes sp. NPDC049599 TaxID=3363903 RepID=UPI0037AC26FF